MDKESIERKESKFERIWDLVLRQFSDRVKFDNLKNDGGISMFRISGDDIFYYFVKRGNPIFNTISRRILERCKPSESFYICRVESSDAFQIRIFDEQTNGVISELRS